MAAQQKAWTVTLRIPGKPVETIDVIAPTNMDAKAEASKLYYGRVFTGQFKYMTAKVKGA